MEELKKLQRKTRQTLGKLASSLLAEALKQQSSMDMTSGKQPALKWRKQSMEARVDLQDKDAIYRAMGEG